MVRLQEVEGGGGGGGQDRVPNEREEIRCGWGTGERLVTWRLLILVFDGSGMVDTEGYLSLMGGNVG